MNLNGTQPMRNPSITAPLSQHETVLNAIMRILAEYRVEPSQEMVTEMLRRYTLLGTLPRDIIDLAQGCPLVAAYGENPIYGRAEATTATIEYIRVMGGYPTSEEMRTMVIHHAQVGHYISNRDCLISGRLQRGMSVNHIFGLFRLTGAFGGIGHQLGHDQQFDPMQDMGA